jgi:hypothetical protein
MQVAQDTDDVILMTDEIQLYFPKAETAKVGKKNPEWLHPFLYQIRKLEATIHCTAPRSYQVNKDFRAVCDYVHNVTKIFWFFIVVKHFTPVSDDWNEYKVVGENGDNPTVDLDYAML